MSGGSEPGNLASQNSSVFINDVFQSTATEQDTVSINLFGQPELDLAASGTAQLSSEYLFFVCSICGDSWSQALLAEPPNEDVKRNLPQAAWPVDTDLVYSTGSNKLRLTNQRPLVRAVLHEAIELLRAAMLFNNSFPDVCAALGLIKDCVFRAAEKLKPGTAEIFERLTHDADYLSKITPLVWFAPFRNDFTDDTS